MEAKKTKPDVMTEHDHWCQGHGGKWQEFGGKWSFFGPRSESSRDFPLLWIDFDRNCDASLALVAEKKQMHYWLGKKTYEEMQTLFDLLGVVPWEAPCPKDEQ